PAGTATTQQQHFATPEAAVQALVAALAAQETKGTSELIAILGPKGKPIVDSGDPVADANARQRFGEAYAQFHVIQESGDRRATSATTAGPSRCRSGRMPRAGASTPTPATTRSSRGGSGATSARRCRPASPTSTRSASTTRWIPTRTSCSTTRRSSAARRAS